jgi:hypothetical protein
MAEKPRESTLFAKGGGHGSRTRPWCCYDHEQVLNEIRSPRSNETALLLVPALILGTQACLLLSPLHADNRFFIGEITVPEKSTDQKLYVHCEHDAAARAYSLSIQYDAKAMRVTSIAHEGTSVENPDFWGTRARMARSPSGSCWTRRPP